MTLFHLVPAAEGEPIPLAPGPPRVVGRTAASDIPVYDGTISRAHAELVLLGEGVRVRDLGSTNGTFVNGARVEDHVAQDGDTLTFGSVSFRLARADPQPEAAAAPARAPEFATARHEVSHILKKLPVASLPPPLHPDETAPGGRDRSSSLFSLVRSFAEERTARRLAVLLEVATELGRHSDADLLLERIVELAYTALRVDRACLLAVEGDALELVPRVVRVRRGEPAGAGHVPRAIAYQVLSERVAILSDDVGQDERFASDSARALERHCALCVPLLGQGEEVLGLLYLETADLRRPFGEEDLQFMAAFAGLAAAALDHQRLRRAREDEAAVLERLRRYLSPALAAEVALREGQVSLLHPARRPLVLLECRLHDFAASADALQPADLADLLGDYLSRVANAVLEYGGTLDTICGHVVLALWGAPLARPDGADRALRAALQARAAVAELERRWKSKGVARLELAVGVAAGEAFVGDVALGQRVEYTVAGALTDEAARLCAEAGGAGVLVSETLYRALSNPPPARVQRVPGLPGDPRRLTLQP